MNVPTPSQPLSDERRTSVLSGLASYATPPSLEDDDADRALQRRLGYRVACTLKALTPIQQIIAFEQAGGMSDTDAAKLCREIILACRKHSAYACEAVEMSADSAEWARSYFATHIATQLAEVWPKLGRKALDIDWSVAISEIAVPHFTEGLPPTWKNTDAEVSIAATMMAAVQTIMSAYDSFNLYHLDRNSIQSWATKLLLEKSIECATRVGDAQGLNETNQASLAQSLMKNGGQVMTSVWQGVSRRLIAAMKKNPSARAITEVRDNGYPLTEIEIQFTTQMDSLASVATMTMEGIVNAFAASKGATQDAGASLE